MQIQPRDYSSAEDVANTWSAAAGLIVFLGFSPLLCLAAAKTADAAILAGALIFSCCVVFLYLSSTLYHALPRGQARTAVRLFDHSAIFLLIAGTYTPFALGPLRQQGGNFLLMVEWGLAILGIIFKIAGNLRFQHIANFIYIGMGWLGIFWVKPFFQEVSWQGCAWILGGGVCYTAGIVFYAAKHRAYAHFVWHLFVFAGTCCHTYAIWRYAL